MSSSKPKKRVRPPSIRDVLERDGFFRVQRYSSCVKRWEVVASATMSKGLATLSFDLFATQGPPFPSFLKIYAGKSRKPSKTWELPEICQCVYDLSTWEDILMFELRRRNADGSLPKAKDDFIDPWFAKHAPCVGQVVFQCAYPDGTARKAGFFTMWRSPDGVTVKVTDNEVQMCWQYSAETFEAALKMIEKALVAGMAGNRAYSTKTGRKK